MIPTYFSPYDARCRCDTIWFQRVKILFSNNPWDFTQGPPPLAYQFAGDLDGLDLTCRLMNNNQKRVRIAELVASDFDKSIRRHRTIDDKSKKGRKRVRNQLRTMFKTRVAHLAFFGLFHLFKGENGECLVEPTTAGQLFWKDLEASCSLDVRTALTEYQFVWDAVVEDLLLSHPWRGYGNPKGAHKRIATLRSADLLLLLGGRGQEGIKIFKLVDHFVEYVAKIHSVELDHIAEDSIRKIKRNFLNDLVEHLDSLSEFDLIKSDPLGRKSNVELSDRGRRVFSTFAEGIRHAT